MSAVFRASLATLLVLLTSVAFVSGCTSSQDKAEPSAEMEMPDYVQSAPLRVRQAYEFAAQHPDDLAHQPCYCGCGNMGHTSNLSCYIRDIDDKGNITFDNHAAGCGICVDITQDVMRLKGEGWAALQIRQYVDATYSAFGPSTNTPLPVE